MPARVSPVRSQDELIRQLFMDIESVHPILSNLHDANYKTFQKIYWPLVASGKNKVNFLTLLVCLKEKFPHLTFTTSRWECLKFWKNKSSESNLNVCEKFIKELVSISQISDTHVLNFEMFIKNLNGSLYSISEGLDLQSHIKR
jgi:hypothetical protein